MELTGELKEQVNQSKDRDEARSIIENAGMRLSDDELDSVVGGLSQSRASHLYSAKGDLQELPYDAALQIEAERIIFASPEEKEWRRQRRLEEERYWKMKSQQ